MPAYKSEAASIVTAQHEPLISEALFYQVQNVLDAKRKIQKAKKTEDVRFPLRGYILCSNKTCNKLLTASASKGRKQYYEYYHCLSSCGTRYPAPAVNDAMITELGKWQPHPAVKELYRHILADVYSSNQQSRQQQLKTINHEMTLLSNRHIKARELLLNDAIEADDYKAIKRQCEEKIILLETQVAEITQQPVNIQPQVEKGIAVLEKLGIHYSNANTTIKRQIIDSIFPDKLIFDGSGYRTTRINEAVQLIFNISAAFSQIKNGTTDIKNHLSHQVIPLAPFSNHFLFDLRKLVALHSLLKAS